MAAAHGDAKGNDEFEQKSQKFLDWFKAIPGATFHPDVALVDLRANNAGRGIGKRDIKPDTVLFTIPRSSILWPATSALASKLPDVLAEIAAGEGDEEGNGHDSWITLMLVLMYEQLQRDSSPWKAYLDVLPESFETPMFWTPVELADLQASSILGRIGRAEAESMIRTKIIPIMRAHPSVFFSHCPAPPTDELLVELSHRAGSAIMAYAFDLETHDQSDEEAEDGWVEDRDGLVSMGMVPMADMLNADAEFNAHINHGDDALTATALRAIRAGEEILNYYGPLSNGELLRRYGYVTSRHARYDVVELGWSLVERHLKKWFLDATAGKLESDSLTQPDGEEMADSFVLEREGPDPEPTGLLPGEAVFNGLPEELEGRVKMVIKSMQKTAADRAVTESLSNKCTRQAIYLECVLGALLDREKQYQTSLEQDQSLASERAVTRTDMAVWVRRGEKMLLREAQAWVRKELEKVEKVEKVRAGRAGEVADEPLPKRQRQR